MSPVRTRPDIHAAIGWWRTVVLALAACMVLGGCAAPVQGLWPSQAAPSRNIYVSIDTWHAMIAFPQDAEGAEGFTLRAEPQSSNLSPQSFLFEEWGYAERAWYLEGRQGVSGVVRALFWPTEGVVEVGVFDHIWAARTPQPPSELFTFRVSEEGYRRLRRHLVSTLAGVEPVAIVGHANFYLTHRSYHLFHTCHQYVAHALREAGLPVSALWAFSRGTLAIQLRRASRMAEQGASAVPSPPSP